jgi:hypothetical protein
MWQKTKKVAEYIIIIKKTQRAHTHLHVKEANGPVRPAGDHVLPDRVQEIDAAVEREPNHLDGLATAANACVKCA